MTQSAELVASDPQDLTGLGWSLAMSGNTIVAATIAKCNKAVSSLLSCLNWGAVYVFEQPAGRLVRDADPERRVDLLGPDAANGATHGQVCSARLSPYRVARSSSALMASRSARPIAGAAFVFEEPAGGWSGAMTQDAELTPTDPANDEYFGDAALAVSGSTVVVGAPGSGAPTGGLGHGAAYVFEEPAGGWSGLP